MDEEQVNRAHTRSVPILVDNSLNRAMSIHYAFLSAVGLAGAIAGGFDSITKSFGESISTITSFVIFVSCALAAVGAWNNLRALTWEKLELFSVIAFVSFLTIWSGSAIWLAFTGDRSRATGVFLSTMLCIIPFWRVRFFIKKARN